MRYRHSIDTLQYTATPVNLIVSTLYRHSIDIFDVIKTTNARIPQ